ncbi:MAG TPA: HNH endonuclease [Mycobacteriales bacterium]|nr:HNH endonuclease [Mycobacteriales bacterium]
MVGDADTSVRTAAFAHLDRLQQLSPDGGIRSADINTFTYNDRPMRLIVQTGIWKPARMDAALSIRTTYTPPHEPPPYEDDLGLDGLVRYRYRGTDPNHSDNRALREAMRERVPLIYFVGIASGVYTAHYPVWIIAEDRDHLAFTVAVDEAQRMFAQADVAWSEREYALRLTKQRLHQPVFRTRVLRAYDDTCAMCRLKHAELLDAAHIIPDGKPNGQPVVPNGLSLCKIHHAAYDRDILGIRPDLVVEVQHKVLAEIDGPMLRHGLQEMKGVQIVVPHARHAQPDRGRLEERYEQFLQAG